LLRVKGRGVDGTWQRGHGRNRRGLVAVVIGAERRRRQRSRNCGFGGCEGRAVEYHLPDLGNGGSLSRVEIKDAPEDGIKFQRNGKDAPQELGVLHERAESAVLGRSALPRVASAGEIDKNDSKAPDVVGCRSVAGVSLRRCRLTF
jgi:hypothetical protein